MVADMRWRPLPETIWSRFKCHTTVSADTCLSDDRAGATFESGSDFIQLPHKTLNLTCFSLSYVPTQNSFTSKSDSTSKIALVPSESPGLLQSVAIVDAALPESSNSLQNDWLPLFALANTAGASTLQASVDCCEGWAPPNLCRVVILA